MIPFQPNNNEGLGEPLTVGAAIAIASGITSLAQSIFGGESHWKQKVRDLDQLQIHNSEVAQAQEELKQLSTRQLNDLKAQIAENERNIQASKAIASEGDTSNTKYWVVGGAVISAGLLFLMYRKGLLK